MKSSTTDWIQAVAVVIGVGFALWEFVLHNKTEVQAKKNFVSNLILNSSNEGLITSVAALSRIAVELSNNNAASLKDDIKLNSEILPLKHHYDTWGFCYANDLCDKKLTIRYICDDLILFDHTLRDYASALKIPYLNRDFFQLVSDCKLNG